MAKYIDADLLRKEIDNVEEEARKVRVSGTDKEAIGADGKVKLCLELKAIINSLQQGEPEKPIPNDLEEAAEKYANLKKKFEEKEMEIELPMGAYYLAKDSFIAGVKWRDSHFPKLPDDLDKAARKAAVAPFNFDLDDEHLYEYPYLPIAEQKFKEGAKWQAEHTPLPEDTVLFNKGVEEGKRLMMEEAVEGKVIAVVIHDNGDEIHYSVTYPFGERPHSMFDKVKMLFL